MTSHPVPEKSCVSFVPRAESDSLRRSLPENEDWYRDLVAHSRDLLCIHDLNGRLLLVNPEPARLLGYSVEELLQIPMRDLIVPAFRDEFDAYLGQIARLGEARGFLALMTRSGEPRIWEYHNTLRREGVQSPVVRGMARDVTEQKRSDKQLREAGEQLLAKVRESEKIIRDLKLFRTLVDRSTDAILVVNAETLHFLDANETACVKLGYSREEFLSLRVFDINPTIDEQSLAQIRAELKKSGFVSRESVHRRKDGSTFPVELNMTRVELDRAYVVTIARDLTERKRAEEALRTSERHQHKIAEQLEAERARLVEAQAVAKVGSWEVEWPSLKITWSEQTHRIFETDPSHFHPTRPDFVKFIHPEDRAKVDAAFQSSLEKGAASSVEYRIVMADGRLKILEEQWRVFHDEQGRPIRLMGTCRDVTEQKRAEEALKKSEEKFSKAFRQGPMSLTITSIKDHRYVEVNEAFERMTGWLRDEVIGRTPFDIGLWVNPAERVVLSKQLFLEGRVRGVEARFRKKDGTTRIAFLTAEVLEVNGEACALGVFADITDRREAEEALREAKDFSENLIRTANVIILGLDSEGNVTLFNQAAEEITGYSFEDLRGKNWSTLVPRDRFPEPWEEFERLMAGTAGPTYVNPIITKSGEERYISWRNSQVTVDGKIVATISFGNDVTERRRAEEALRDSEQKYRNFVSRSWEGIFREEMEPPLPIDLPEEEMVHHLLRDAYIAECNDALAAMYGLQSADQLRGRAWHEMVPPEDPQNIDMTREFVRAGFRLREHESHEIDVYGNPKIILNSQIGTVENGKLVRTWGVQRDITEKVRADRARLEAEESLRQAVQQLARVSEELRLAKEKLAEENLYLEQAIDTELGFGEIIGRSAALVGVMEKVARVAPLDATALLLGETGTGKELIARALHRLSKRQGNSFIKVNCAAIPSGLLESELFGHEQGAFTGAVSRKLGRLELADKGTLFLDEIGEIPLSLQPKLLRVLQDQEFERLGGTQTRKVNFRLLAATNCDLLESVRAREFRSDLYYRLNVFPILIPPLRERREDIRPLVEHFVHKFSTRLKKSVTSIPAKTMEILVRWQWPGNIRELENFVERSVILTTGSVLQAPLFELESDAGNGSRGDNLDRIDRERILRILRECHGKLGGADGAAARLGLKRTTLQSKLDHLGIKPAAYRA